MNARIVELTRNPDLIGKQDLALLKKEIAKYPYIQSLRALHLLGTHRLEPEHYAGELSVTAAYTTDKKILYQLINTPEVATESAEEQPVVDKETVNNDQLQETIENPPATVDTTHETNHASTDDHSAYTEVAPKTVEVPATVFVNGERNRLLFPGEEDFLTTDTPLLDLEATLESGSIVLRDAPQVPVPATEELPAEEVATVVDAEERAGNQAAIEVGEGAEDEELKTADTEASETAETETLWEKLPIPAVNEEIVTEEPVIETEEVGESVDAETFTRETVVKEQKIEDEESVVEDPAEVSFHGLDAFLPEVEIPAPDVSSAKDTRSSVDEVATPEPMAETDEVGESIDAESFTRETVVKEQKIEDEEPVVEDPAEVSFHGLDAFLPEVKMPVAEKAPAAAPVADTEPNRHEEERQRLIAEVEARMKAAKKPRTKPTAEEPVNHDVNFAETQSFTPEKNDETEAEIEAAAAPETTINSDWKPMQHSHATPDALIVKNAELSAEVKTEEEIKKLSIPAENDKSASKTVEETPAVEAQTSVQSPPADSNVPAFIDTWQSWLKIERSEQPDHKTQISITEIRNKVIENFIEKEPKISKLRDESDFVIRERNDDIWHLMTETLANLYTEQKLYAKAIKAFQVLTEKHPGKTEHYAGKIAEIKELRQRNGR